MSIITKIPAIFLGCSLVIASFITDVWLQTGVMVSDVEARVGRPMTPVSVAGVARRSTRRAIRRTSVYVATLPTGCTTVIIEGTTLQQCGSTYYQASNNQYVVVNVE